MRIVLFLLCFVANVATADCSKVIGNHFPHKGVVATITEVRVVPGDFPILGKGTRYEFTYRYPNGYTGETWTFFGGDTKEKITRQHRFFWIPANAEVQKAHPKENRVVPVVISPACEIFSVDFSRPSKEIAGL